MPPYKRKRAKSPATPARKIDVTPVGFLQIEKGKQIADGFDKWAVKKHSGNIRKFEKMLALNAVWVLKRTWNKKCSDRADYYFLTSVCPETNELEQMELTHWDGCPYVSGGFKDYSDYRYLMINHQNHLRVYIYQGSEWDMLCFFGLRKCPQIKKYGDEGLCTQFLGLMESAVPVEDHLYITGKK